MGWEGGRKGGRVGGREGWAGRRVGLRVGGLGAKHRDSASAARAQPGYDWGTRLPLSPEIQMVFKKRRYI